MKRNAPFKSEYRYKRYVKGLAEEVECYNKQKQIIQARQLPLWEAILTKLPIFLRCCQEQNNVLHIVSLDL